MKLTQIRHIVAVAKRGSLQSGAEELGVSQNALARSIRNLEQELGTALFKRGEKSMALTAVGEIFVRRATAAQRELDRASREISQNLGAFAGLVSIAIAPNPHVSILPKVLMPFQKRFKDVRVRIAEAVFPKVEREVRDGIIDFYVGPIWPPHRTADLKIDKLYDVGLLVVSRKGHPLAGARSLAELADARWIATSSLELGALFEQHDLPPPIITVEAETGLSMLSAAAACDALLMISASWLPLIERTDLLTLFSLNGQLDCPSIYMVTRTQLPMPPEAAYLHDLIVEASSGTQPSPERSALG
jgi:LysR family transcriptional regulator of abg operon